MFDPATCNLAFAAMTGESAIAAVEVSSDETTSSTAASEGLAKSAAKADSQQLAKTVGQEQLQRALAAAGALDI